ncbi:MAG: hypothetical protein ACRD1R_21590 [Acidobacteriota bacterium]
MMNPLKAEVIASEGLYPQSKKADPAVRKLALGILLQAFRDVVTPRRAPSKEDSGWKKDAIEWFYSYDEYPGSLIWVCDILQMDPNGLREWLDHFRQSDGRSKTVMALRLIHFRIPH